MTFSLPLLASGMTALGVVALVWLVAGDRREAGRPGPLSLRDAELAASVGTRAVRPAVRWLARRARRLTPLGLIEAMDRRVKLAGMEERFSLERALALKFAVALFGLVLGLLTIAAGARAIGLGLIVLGYFAVDGVMLSRAQERQKQIQRELPDALDQLTISVEAGLGFEAAMERASRHSGPLAYELSRTLGEIQLGLSRREAMAHLVTRTDVQDLRRFVAALVHAEGFGVPLARVLRTQAADLRDKRRQRAQERAARIPVLLSFPLVFFVLPATFVVLLVPAFIQIINALGGELPGVP